MATLKFTSDPSRPPKLTTAQKSRLDAMTEEEIERNAKADLDNPPLTEDELERAAFARFVRQTREKLGLSQSQFAERFEINLRRLQDMEQARFKPDSALVAYMKVISKAAETVVRALAYSA